jgi:hypothetical protein
MTEFTAKSEELKKAFSVVSMAAEEGATETIGGHALFNIKGGDLYLYTTDKDKMAMASVKLTAQTTGNDQETPFTSDPKKILALLNSSEEGIIRFVYDQESKTLNVYASEDKDSYLSFASFNPKDFLTFDNELSAAKEIKKVNAGVFLSGIKFSQGFLPTDENKKFNNAFIINGIMYSSNGSNRIGAFESPEFTGIISMILRKIMLVPIATLIDKTDATDISIRETEKVLVILSDDGNYAFGFRKSLIEPPKFPISTEKPIFPAINMDRNTVIKKLNRLSITSTGEIGIKFTVDKETMTLNTVTDRKSVENMTCKRVSGSDNVDFSFECKLLKTCLGLFQTPGIDVYIDKARCTLWSEAKLEIMEKDKKEPTVKSFKAVALVSQARVA